MGERERTQNSVRSRSFMTRQCGKLMQLSYDTIAFLGFSQRNRNIEDISRQKFRELL